MDTTTKLKVGFAALMILSGIGVASYPVISNAVAQRHASEAIQNYDDTVKSMDTEKLDAAKEAARRYNQQLDNAVERDAAGEAEDTGTSYVDLVDVGESLGYITIPKIDVNLPIYEGTIDDVLQKGVGHLEGSSYPLGGESTHSVLTGHRGLPEAVLFTDLDKLEEGDCFYLHILDETLAYQVDQIKVVEPGTPRIWKSPRGRITAPLLPARRMPSTPTACLCAAPASLIMERKKPTPRRPCSIRRCAPERWSSAWWMPGRGSR